MNVGRWNRLLGKHVFAASHVILRAFLPGQGRNHRAQEGLAELLLEEAG